MRLRLSWLVVPRLVQQRTCTFTDGSPRLFPYRRAILVSYSFFKPYCVVLAEEIFATRSHSACDAQKPSWIAFYDIASPSVFSHDSYTRLRANRSPREAALVSSLEILDRRTYEVVSDSGVPDANISTSWKPENPSHWVVTEGFGSSDEASENEAGEKWMQDARGAIDGARGWVRTRTFKLLEGGALRSGLGVGKGKEEQTVPRYLALHGQYLRKEGSSERRPSHLTFASPRIRRVCLERRDIQSSASERDRISYLESLQGLSERRDLCRGAEIVRKLMGGGPKRMSFIPLYSHTPHIYIDVVPSACLRQSYSSRPLHHSHISQSRFSPKRGQSPTSDRLPPSRGCSRVRAEIELETRRFLRDGESGERAGKEEGIRDSLRSAGSRLTDHISLSRY